MIHDRSLPRSLPRCLPSSLPIGACISPAVLTVQCRPPCCMSLQSAASPSLALLVSGYSHMKWTGTSRHTSHPVARVTSHLHNDVTLCLSDVTPSQWRHVRFRTERKQALTHWRNYRLQFIVVAEQTSRHKGSSSGMYFQTLVEQHNRSALMTKVTCQLDNICRLIHLCISFIVKRGTLITISNLEIRCRSITPRLLDEDNRENDHPPNVYKATRTCELIN